MIDKRQARIEVSHTIHLLRAVESHLDREVKRAANIVDAEATDPGVTKVLAYTFGRLEAAADAVQDARVDIRELCRRAIGDEQAGGQDNDNNEGTEGDE